MKNFPIILLTEATDWLVSKRQKSHFTVHKFNIYSTQIRSYKMESKYQGGVITKVYMINL